MRLAIIGAGVAGLAAARALRQRRPDFTITIYEQSQEPGGRVMTGRRAGFAFDHGAQYVKSPTPEVERLLTVELPTDDLIDIARPVWTFDGANVIAVGDPAQNADPKWTYRDGLDRLGKLLAAGLDVRRAVRIGALRPSAAAASRYELLDATGRVAGAAEMVLFTAPAPQTAEIVIASDLDADVRERVLPALGQVSYRRCVSIALAYDWRVERPFYALVNSDRAHPIAWLAFEHDKGPGRCPPGHSLLIAQMAPQFSRDFWDAPAEELAQTMAEQVSVLLQEDLRRPLWSDIQRWRYALPDAGADFAALNRAGGGLFFAGDYTAGQGRVHLAIESGWRAAALIEVAR